VKESILIWSILAALLLVASHASAARAGPILTGSVDDNARSGLYTYRYALTDPWNWGPVDYVVIKAAPAGDAAAHNPVDMSAPDWFISTDCSFERLQAFDLARQSWT
jgi:hypothetical protein